MLRREAEGDGDVEIGQRAPSAGRTSRARWGESCRPRTGRCADNCTPSRFSQRDRIVEPVDPRNGTTGRCPSSGAKRRTRRAPAWACRPRAAGPCRNGGNRRSPRPRVWRVVAPRPAADRRGCTSGCAAPGRPAVRRSASRPQTCTSSAPKVETPTSLTQIGRSVTAPDLVDLLPATRGSARGSSRAGSRARRRRRHGRARPAPSWLHERRIDRRDAAEHARQRAALSAAIASPASDRHLGEPPPVRDRAPGPSATCCWARSRSSRLRSCRCFLARG